MSKYELISKACDTCGGTNVQELNTAKRNGTSIVIEDGPDIIQKTDVICMDCGLIYKYPMMTKESQKKFYDEDYSRLFRKGYDDTISRSMVVYTMTSAIQVADWLGSVLDIGKLHILDVGAGDGMFMKTLECTGAKIIGIDQDKRGAEIAKKLVGLDIIDGDFMQAEWEGTFDLVCLRNTLEHMYSPREALERAGDLIGDGGHILVEVPMADRPYIACNVQAFLSAAHNYTFSLQSLSALADKVGLGIQELSLQGHQGCAMVLLSKKASKFVIPNDTKEYLELLKEIYSEHDKTYFNKNDIIKELLASTNVNNSIGEIISHKHTSNFIVYMLLTTLLGMPNKQDFIATIFDTYQWNDTQAFDVNCCKASFEYLKGMFYRELGDFSNAKKVLNTAKLLYPAILTKNFVKELLLEGVLSESIFVDYLWYSCYKQCNIM